MNKKSVFLAAGILLLSLLLTNTSHDIASVVCNLSAPPAPLSATGLSTPYRLHICSESDTNNAVFVQATIYDPSTNTVSVYNPLVVNGSSKPAVAPTPVTLPNNAVVALWIGANNNLHVTEDDPNFQFVQGTSGSPFTQQAYLNVPLFLIAASSVSIPPIGVAADRKSVV